MLHLVLAEAEIERVPEHLWSHPQVVADARTLGMKASRLALDSSRHHAALRMVPQGDRRGRPDILHMWLLTVLESRACKAGLVQPWVHTRHDLWVRVDPTTRLVRHYLRFLGLLEQLLDSGHVGPPGLPLLHATPGVPLKEGLAKLPQPRIAFETDGAETPPARVASRLGTDATLIMGGFPHGTYNQADALEGADRVAIPGGPLAVWTVASDVLAHYATLHVDHVA